MLEAQAAGQCDNSDRTIQLALLTPERRVRVTWSCEGEIAQMQGVIRAAQGRKSGKLLSDNGDVVIFALSDVISVEELV